MSRSKRKNPFCGLTKCESEKQDKIIFHKHLRRKSKQHLRSTDDFEDLLLEAEREASDVYSWDKDGKQRFDPNVNPECMRK